MEERTSTGFLSSLISMGLEEAKETVKKSLENTKEIREVFTVYDKDFSSFEGAESKKVPAWKVRREFL